MHLAERGWGRSPGRPDRNNLRWLSGPKITTRTLLFPPRYREGSFPRSLPVHMVRSLAPDPNAEGHNDLHDLGREGAARRVHLIQPCGSMDGSSAERYLVDRE